MEQDVLQGMPNVLPYGEIIDTEAAAYLVRQWVANNLYDRIRYVAMLTQYTPVPHSVGKALG